MFTYGLTPTRHQAYTHIPWYPLLITHRPGAQSMYCQSNNTARTQYHVHGVYKIRDLCIMYIDEHRFGAQSLHSKWSCTDPALRPHINCLVTMYGVQSLHSKWPCTDPALRPHINCLVTMYGVQSLHSKWPCTDLAPCPLHSDHVTLNRSWLLIN